jgi:hypothetical protein
MVNPSSRLVQISKAKSRAYCTSPPSTVTFVYLDKCQRYLWILNSLVNKNTLALGVDYESRDVEVSLA